MILNYQMIVETGEAPKPNGVVSSSIPGHEIVSLLDGKVARWSNASIVSRKEKEKVMASSIGKVKMLQ